MEATAQMPPESTAAERRDAFVERLVQSFGGAFDVFALYLGDRLGFYEALAAKGAMTPPQLAADTDTAERYVREWLEQQAVTGVLTVENPDAPADARRFVLPAGHDEALADPESLNYVLPLAQVFAGAVRPLGQLVEAYRTGAGVPFADYGRDMREGQGRANRAMFLHQLGQEYLPALPDVHERLQAGGRVADIGCGVGWSSIGMAQAYPNAEVHGFDLDAPSVEEARAHAEAHGVAGRVTFHHRDAGDPDLAHTTSSPPSSASTTWAIRWQPCVLCAASPPTTVLY